MPLPFHSQVQILVPAGTAPLSIVSTTLVDNLNADLLDGQHGSFYLNAGNLNAGTIPTGRLSGTYPISISGSADVVSVADTRAVTTTPQTINRSVVFDFKENSSNGLNDGGNYFGLMTFRQYGSNTDWSGGLSHQLGFTDNGNIWQRSGSNTTWGSWKKLWDDANDGAGSGLDADLLDGQHGSYYAAASSLGNYLPLSGGTLTGSVYVNTNDAIRVSWQTNDHLWIRGYGLEFGRVTSYLRPGSNNGASLFVGGSTINQIDWANIDFYSSGRFNINDNPIIHAGNYTSYLNNTYLRAAGHPGYNDWNVFGNTAQTVNSIFQENFNIPTSTGSSNFPTNAAYKYGTLVNFGSGSDARAQVYISHAGNDLVFRGGWGTASWQTWNRCLTDQNYTSYALPLTGGTLTGNLTISGASLYHRITDGTNVLQLGLWDGSNCRIEASGRPLYMVSYNGAITIGRSSGTNLVIDTSSLAWGGNALLHAGNYNSYSPPLAQAVYGDNSTATTALSESNLDTALKSGFYTVSKVDNSKLPASSTSVNFLIHCAYYGVGNLAGIDLLTQDNTASNLFFRNATGAGKGAWRTILDSSNYNIYAPTLTGTGASGTWGISITGSAVSSTTQAKSVSDTSIATTAFSKWLFATFGTGGTTDWNHVSNTMPGTGTTLLRGSDTNGFGPSQYYHPVNFEYAGTGGTGNVTQLAVAYGLEGNDLRMRGRYSGTWTSWVQFLNSSNYNSYAPTLTGTGASGTWGISISGSAAQLNGQAASFYQNAGNLNAGTLPSARLSGTYTIDIAGAASSGSRLGLWDDTTYITGSNTISGTGGRGVNLAPNTYVKQISFEFKNTSFASMGGNYGGLITIAPWDGTAVSTGDPNYQLLFSASAANSTSNPVLRLRAGIDAGWGAWATLIHDANFSTAIPNSGVTSGTYNNVTVNAKGIVTGGSNVSYLTGNQSISITGDATGSGTTSISLTLANSGVGAGTYRSVTVDAKGRVTGGTNPTTFSGYGISDIAYGSTGSRNVWTITDWNQTTYQNAHFLSSENTHTNGPTSDYIYGLQTSFHRSGAAYRTQMVTELYGSPVSIWVRNSRDSDVWTAWSKLLHSNNYTDYAPTKTGSGASGSWGISITGSSASCTGNAATATTATNSTQLNGQAASYYENRDTTAVSISSGTLTLTRAAGNLTATIGGRVVAWCEFNGNFASSQSPNAAFNVSSITKNATGDYTVNFTSALANANYVVSGTAQLDAPSPGQSVNNVFVAVPRRSGAKATGSCRIVCEYPSGLSLWDCGSVGVAFIAA